jgi:hypothetical protein
VKSSARSALTKTQSLSLKAQERYRCSHSNRSAGEGTEAMQGVRRPVESLELINQGES